MENMQPLWIRCGKTERGFMTGEIRLEERLQRKNVNPSTLPSPPPTILPRYHESGLFRRLLDSDEAAEQVTPGDDMLFTTAKVTQEV